MTAAQPVHQTSASGVEPRWRFAEGEEIAPGRTALKRLGGGHRYDAYIVWDDALHAVVVAKVLRPHLVEDARALEGLAEEWEMLESLRHPVIVRGFDAVLEGPRPHVVLEHLEGPRLSTLIRRYGPLPVDQLLPLALQLSAALHYLGTRGIVHLDLKPSNTIMGAPPRLIDLSVALRADEASALRSRVGTDAYMAPEQVEPEALGPVSYAADVWGLGITLYKAATGALPYEEAEEDAGDRWPQVDEEPRWPEGIDAQLAELIMSCLSKDPRARPAPDELHAVLEPVIAGMPAPRLSRLKPRL
ncbi:MAG TPA: serine/threonine-protein kinase [Solirubrobacterales bacterium]|nr:serine/threonine-protein kinase [Solirubrobacterales bacterium]